MRDGRQEPEYPDDVHQEWLEKIEAEGRNLTEWEQDFIDDLFRYKKRLVSRKQEALLERIYVNKTPT